MINEKIDEFNNSKPSMIDASLQWNLIDEVKKSKDTYFKQAEKTKSRIKLMLFISNFDIINK